MLRSRVVHKLPRKIMTPTASGLVLRVLRPRSILSLMRMMNGLPFRSSILSSTTKNRSRLSSETRSESASLRRSLISSSKRRTQERELRLRSADCMKTFRISMLSSSRRKRSRRLKSIRIELFRRSFQEINSSKMRKSEGRLSRSRLIRLRLLL